MIRRRKQTPIRTTARTVLAAFLLAGLPFIAVSAHTQLQPTEQYFTLTVSAAPADNGAAQPAYGSALSPLHIGLLAGDNSFRLGDPAYIHASVSGGQIGYAFAINRDFVLTEDRPHAVTLRGFVERIDGDELYIRYPFDAAIVTATQSQASPFEAKLWINKNGGARLLTAPSTPSLISPQTSEAPSS